MATYLQRGKLHRLEGNCIVTLHQDRDPEPTRIVVVRRPDQYFAVREHESAHIHMPKRDESLFDLLARVRQEQSEKARAMFPDYYADREEAE